MDKSQTQTTNEILKRMEQSKVIELKQDEIPKDKPVIEPFTPEHTRVAGVLTEKPPEPEYLIKFKDKGLISRGIVGSMAAAGGTGKTQLKIQLAIASAAGKPFAYFTVDNPITVLLLAAEETQDDLDRRLWNACNGQFTPNLFARSIKGIVGPLMYLDGNEPKRSEWWHWLDQTIANHEGLDLLILDPKSRLYGLDENSNDHNTQWVASLESLTIKHKIAILFTHHVPKGTKEINQWMARGGSALVDACRTNMGMIQLSENEAKKFNLENWKNYVKIGISKINIGPKDSGDAHLRFDEQGILHPVNIYDERINSMKNHFLFLLGQEKEYYSRRELLRDKSTTHIIDKMKAACPSFTRSTDTNLIIDALLDDGMLIETTIDTGRRPKMILKWNNGE